MQNSSDPATDPPDPATCGRIRRFFRNGTRSGQVVGALLVLVVGVSLVLSLRPSRPPGGSPVTSGASPSTGTSASAFSASGLQIPVADPPGTVTLASGDSAFAREVEVEGASGAGLLLGMAEGPTGEEHRQVFLPKKGDPQPLDPPISRYSEGWGLFGSLLVADEVADSASTAVGPGHLMHYRSVDGSVAGTRVESSVPNASQLGSITPVADGWVVVDDSAAPVLSITHVAAASGVRTSLSSPAPCAELTAYEAGLTGLALVCRSATGPAEVLSYRSFLPGGAWSELATWQAGQDWEEIGLHVDGSDVFTASARGVVRYPVDGGAAQTLPPPPTMTDTNAIDPDYLPYPLKVTRTHLGLQGRSANGPGLVWATIPRTGGSWTAVDTPEEPWSLGVSEWGSVPLGAWLSDGDSFVFSSRGSSSGSGPWGVPGVFAMHTADAKPVLRVPREIRRLQASAVAVGPDRVAWADDSRSPGAVWSSSLTRGGAGLRVGKPTSLGFDAVDTVAVSGPRTLTWQLSGASGPLVLRGPDGSTRIARSTGVGQISGNRVIYSDYSDPQDETEEPKTHLLDLDSGREVTIPPGRLWEDFLAWADGRTVHVRSVTTGQDTVVSDAAEHQSVGEPVIWGDHVAWTSSTLGPAGEAEATTVSYRNYRTMGPTTTIRIHAVGLALTSQFLVVVSPRDPAAGHPADEAPGLATIRLGSATVVPRGARVASTRGDMVSADGAVVGWVDDVTGEPKIALLHE